MPRHETVAHLTKEKLDVNFTFYYLIKRLNSSEVKLTDIQIRALLNVLYSFKEIDPLRKFEILLKRVEEITKVGQKQDNLKSLFITLQTSDDFFLLLEYALQLLTIKPYILAQARLTYEALVVEEINQHHPLSIEYDKVSSGAPYYLRVSGALLALLLFEQIDKEESKFLSKIINTFADRLNQNHSQAVTKGLEPNQIFMIMFSESIDQSIKSSAGGSYEDRIKDVLIAAGVPKDGIIKAHDRKDSSTEYDFVFEYMGKQVGIGAKRTLRERYKQFLKTSGELDVDLMIQITLGTDLTETRVDTITSKYKVTLIVADEIYNYPTNKYLRKNDNVFKASDLNSGLLKTIIEHHS